MKYAEISAYPSYFKWHWPEPGFEIEAYLRAELEVHDADSCGAVTSHWCVVEEGPKFYRCYHSWWIDDGSNDHDGWEIHNEFEIKEVTREAMLAEDDYGSISQNLKCLV